VINTCKILRSNIALYILFFQVGVSFRTRTPSSHPERIKRKIRTLQWRPKRDLFRETLISKGKIVFYDSHKELHLTKRQIVKKLERLGMDGNMESSVTWKGNCVLALVVSPPSTLNIRLIVSEKNDTVNFDMDQPRESKKPAHNPSTAQI